MPPNIPWRFTGSKAGETSFNGDSVRGRGVFWTSVKKVSNGSAQGLDPGEMVLEDARRHVDERNKAAARPRTATLVWVLSTYPKSPNAVSSGSGRLAYFSTGRTDLAKRFHEIHERSEVCAAPVRCNIQLF
jgi:hypothetical protein